MPRQVIGYEGDGRVRRPIYRDEVLDPGPNAGLPVGSPEAAAAIARVGSRAGGSVPISINGNAPLNSAAHLAKSRMNGARRHVEVMAERRATTPKEEDPMPLSIEEPAATVELDPLEHLATVAAEAARARQAKVAADEAWAVARTALREAYAVVSLDVGDLKEFGRRFDEATPFHVEDLAAEAEASVPLDEHPEAAQTVKPSAAPKRQPGHHATKAQEAQEKVERARRVMATMERLGGDQRAVATELGMRPNAVAMVVKHAPRLLGQATP